MAKVDPHGPEGAPVVGTNLRYALTPFAFMEECAEEYGDVVRIDAFNEEMYQVTHPDAIERVLVRNAENYRKPVFTEGALRDMIGEGMLLSEGEQWRAGRERLQSAFHPGRIEEYADAMAAHARQSRDRLAEGDRIDVREAMTDVTIRIIVETILGTRPAGIERAVADALTTVGDIFRSDSPEAVLPDAVPSPRKVRYERANAKLDRIVDQIVAEHRRTPTAGDPDVVDLLLAARDAGEIDDEVVHDELLTMLLAGHETTALAMTYAWYLLGKYPEPRRRFHAEVDALDGPPTLDDVGDLEYTEWVLREAMRLYPPVHTVYREALADDELVGYHVPAGTTVALPQWVVHRDERFFEEPLAFRPGRWGEDADRPRSAYFPFGAGPRRCIGERFSLLEGKLVMATIARRWDLELASTEPLDLIAGVTMRPEHPVEVRVRER